MSRLEYIRHVYGEEAFNIAYVFFSEDRAIVMSMNSPYTVNIPNEATLWAWLIIRFTGYPQKCLSSIV